MHTILAVIALLAVDAATPAPKPAGIKSASDPNKIICEKEDTLGSRLQAHKICMTRAQWAERRRNDRDVVDRSQTNVCTRQGGC